MVAELVRKHRREDGKEGGHGDFGREAERGRKKEGVIVVLREERNSTVCCSAKGFVRRFVVHFGSFPKGGALGTDYRDALSQ